MVCGMTGAAENSNCDFQRSSKKSIDNMTRTVKKKEYIYGRVMHNANQT